MEAKEVFWFDVDFLQSPIGTHADLELGVKSDRVWGSELSSSDNFKMSETRLERNQLDKWGGSPLPDAGTVLLDAGTDLGYLTRNILNLQSYH